MSGIPFITYRKFNDEHAAADLIALLRACGIECEFENATQNFDPSFAFNSLSKDFRVKLAKQDFERADDKIREFYEEQAMEVDESYYLFSFTEEELIEVLAKRDEWSELDFVLARRLLRERGYVFPREAIEQLRDQRVEELAKPQNERAAWVVFGYIFSAVGGLPGFIIGWALLMSRKTLPNGESVYSYSENNRKHGRWIMYAGALGAFFWIWQFLQGLEVL